MSVTMLRNLRKYLKDAMKEQNAFKKAVLRGVIVEATKLSTKDEPNDDQVVIAIRKIVDKNIGNIAKTEKEMGDRSISIDTVEHRSWKNNILQENDYLAQFLPKNVEGEALAIQLHPVYNEIMQAQNDGAATGLAVKFLKQINVSAAGKDVATLVHKIRKTPDDLSSTTGP